MCKKMIVKDDCNVKDDVQKMIVIRQLKMFHLQ